MELVTSRANPGALSNDSRGRCAESRCRYLPRRHLVEIPYYLRQLHAQLLQAIHQPNSTIKMSSQEASMQKKTVTKSTHLFSRIVRRFRSTPKSFEATTFPTQTKLCTICENLISNYEDRGWHPSSPFMFREARNITVPHHENLVSFERAVAEGCALCNHLSISAAQNITRLRERYQGFPELGFALELQHISWEEGMTMRWNACRPTSHFPQNDEGHDRTLAELWLRKGMLLIRYPDQWKFSRLI